MNKDLPVEKLASDKNWDQLPLKKETMGQVEEIRNWLEYHHKVEKKPDLKKKISPGYKALFLGPPGTGKTLTATLLGKRSGKDVYRVDLSKIISKYIGETEKNLSKIFDEAANKDWILFFDEADALFGKRSSVKDAHDRYANQEVAYLVQKLEDHPGLVILATNIKANIDEAFARRFNSVIKFS